MITSNKTISNYLIMIITTENNKEKIMMTENRQLLIKSH